LKTGVATLSENRRLPIRASLGGGSSKRFIEIAACRVRAPPCRLGVQRCRPTKLQGRIGLARPEKKYPDGLVTIPVQA
jgi:hypothetical protein